MEKYEAADLISKSYEGEDYYQPSIKVYLASEVDHLLADVARLVEAAKKSIKTYNNSLGVDDYERKLAKKMLKLEEAIADVEARMKEAK